MKHQSLWVAMAAAMLLLPSCNKGAVAPQQEPENNEILPEVAVELPTKAAEFVQKSQGFTFDFIDRINASAQGNYIVSPLSLQFLLGMLLNGAQGETADEICQVLGYGAGDVDQVNEYFRGMMEALPALDPETTLSLANAMFVNQAYPVRESYRSVLADYYDAESSSLDFLQPESLKAINGWAYDHTNGLIPQVLDTLNPEILAYLMNAVYFKSCWNRPFTKENTSEQAFTCEDGGIVRIKMMQQQGRFFYGEADSFRLVRLPYGNGTYEMLVLLPKEGFGLADVTAELKGAGLPRAMSDLLVNLWLPNFYTKFDIRLNDLLAQMGMPLAFDPAKADFRKMSDYAWYLSFVKQYAAITVDEEGSEAAAITIGGIDVAYSPDPTPLVFHADRPFLYLITETSTGAVLFAGRYSKP